LYETFKRWLEFISRTPPLCRRLISLQMTLFGNLPLSIAYNIILYKSGPIIGQNFVKHSKATLALGLKAFLAIISSIDSLNSIFVMGYSTSLLVLLMKWIVTTSNTLLRILIVFFWHIIFFINKNWNKILCNFIQISLFSNHLALTIM